MRKLYVGSGRRDVSNAIVDVLSEGPKSIYEIKILTRFPESRLYDSLEVLHQEGLVTKVGSKYVLDTTSSGILRGINLSTTK